MKEETAKVTQTSLNLVSSMFFSGIFKAYRIKLKDGSYIVAVRRIESDLLLELDCLEGWNTRKIKAWLEEWNNNIL